MCLTAFMDSLSLTLDLFIIFARQLCCSSTLMLFFTSVCDTTHGHHNVVGSRVFVQQAINIGQKIILMALQRQGNLEYQSFQTLYNEGITSISINVCSSSQLHARTHTHTHTHTHAPAPTDTRTLLKKGFVRKNQKYTAQRGRVGARPDEQCL